MTDELQDAPYVEEDILSELESINLRVAAIRDSLSAIELKNINLDPLVKALTDSNAIQTQIRNAIWTLTGVITAMGVTFFRH